MKRRRRELRAKQKREELEAQHKREELRTRRNYLVLFSAIVLTVAVAAGVIYYRNEASKAAAQAYRRDRSIFVRDYSPSIGSPAAKVEIVEFFDPACGTCKLFYPRVKQLMDEHPGEIYACTRVTRRFTRARMAS